MGLKSFFKRQLSTVVEWKDQESNYLFYKIPTPTSEIKNASKLIVSPGQGCILVYDGKVQDVLDTPGVYLLSSKNIPFITTLLKLSQAFESEHKMHLYFFRTAEIVNQSWGTSNPIKYIDSQYNIPIELGAYGNYSVRMEKQQELFTNVIGSKDVFTTEDLREIITGRIIASLTSYLAQSAFSYNQIDAHLILMSEQIKANLNQTLDKLGLVLTDFQVESCSFDENTKEHIQKIASMTTEALAAEQVGMNYIELEKLRALRDAAQNEGGLAGAGLQMGAGFELSKTIMDQKPDSFQGAVGDKDPIEQLKALKELVDQQILTQEEFETKKREILSRI
ncbi:SPFH domain-containing protein [Myroides sp. LJL116]